jgi:hypothetical protein
MILQSIRETSSLLVFNQLVFWHQTILIERIVHFITKVGITVHAICLMHVFKFEDTGTVPNQNNAVYNFKQKHKPTLSSYLNLNTCIRQMAWTVIPTLKWIEWTWTWKKIIWTEYFKTLVWDVNSIVYHNRWISHPSSL